MNQEMKDQIDVAGVQAVMKRLDLAVNVAESVLPQHLSPYVANALLNVTVRRMISVEGHANTAELLAGLSDLILNGANPDQDGPIKLRSQTD